MLIVPMFFGKHSVWKVNLAYEAERDEKILRLRENGNKMRTVPFALQQTYICKEYMHFFIVFIYVYVNV